MGFYTYFEIAKKFCPSKLKPFAPAIYYEVARKLEMFSYFYGVPAQRLEAIYGEAYDRIVERIGEQIAKENYLQSAEKHVSYRNQQSGHKER